MMDKTIKQIIFILLLATLLGLARFYFLKDESFTLIKEARVLQEAEVQVSDSGEAVFTIPDFMTEPMMANLEFTKYFFDNKNAVFVDARESEEFELAHIAGAINIPFDYYDEYMETIDALNYDDVFIIYCSGGECSLSLDLADVFFGDKAFENIFVFEGGLPAWKDAGYPTE
jgi:rhodanese-related sulfurtransferase